MKLIDTYNSYPGLIHDEFKSERWLYIVFHKDVETDMLKKADDLKINQFRPYYYDSFNRVGNCTLLNLNE